MPCKSLGRFLCATRYTAAEVSTCRHVPSIVSSCNFHTCALRHIRPHLTLDAAKSVAVGIVAASLDYSLLYGTSQRNLDCLQCVQNSLACTVTQALHHTSVTELWPQLHWLPIRQRIDYKLGTITFRDIHTGVPGYLASELHRHQPSRALCSGATTLLRRPHTSSDFHRHSSAVSAPAVWTNIPTAVRDSISLKHFQNCF